MDGGLVAALAEVVGPISSEVEARIQGIFTSFTIWLNVVWSLNITMQITPLN